MLVVAAEGSAPEVMKMLLVRDPNIKVSKQVSMAAAEGYRPGYMC